MDARIILDPPADGAWNMAVDEALLQAVGNSGQPCLRFYQWSPPTLSLGYFQRFRDRQQHPPGVALPVVRRATGGGAIVHHFELTYSLALPWNSRRPGEAMQWYEALHETAREVLKRRGVPAEFWRGAPTAGNDQAAFLCFARRAALDLVAGDQKLLGSAQRRARGALLQHGSLLLEASPYAAELRGAAHFAPPSALIIDEVCRDWRLALSRRLGWHFTGSQLTDAEQLQARSAARSRFADKGWTQRRT
jgi:lipoyl(octanoyl) transferase